MKILFHLFARAQTGLHVIQAPLNLIVELTLGGLYGVHLGLMQIEFLHGQLLGDDAVRIRRQGRPFGTQLLQFLLNV